MIRFDKQIVLASATFPGKLRDVVKEWADDPLVIRCNTMEFHTTSSKDRNIGTKGEDDKEQLHDIIGNTPQINDEKDGESNCLENQDSTDNANDANIDSNKSETITSSLTISKTISQHIHVCSAHKKPRLLIKHINSVREQEKQSGTSRQQSAMIIFVNKIASMKYIKEFLTKNDIKVDMIHGQLQQSQREKVISDFRAGKLNTLIATDVAGRGVHIKRIKYVVNYDFPGNLEQYCHRVGRTGRGGDGSGSSYSLLTRNMAPIVPDLIQLLQACDQNVEQELYKLVEQS